MALEFITEDYEKKYRAQWTVDLSAGQKLEIKIGAETISATVPSGKKWSGYVVALVEQSDS